MTDFFISYTGVDRIWAEWIAYVLEEEGFTTKIQAWDFRPGSNFVLEMQEAADAAERAVMVLSPDYLKSKMAASEWAAAFAKDPQGLDRRIVPVMVRQCEPGGLLPQIVQIRIFDLDEDEARAALIEGVNLKRAKPSKRPNFPGAAATITEHKTFPGQATEPVRSISVIPALKSRPTELQIRKFVKEGFATIRERFVSNLEAAKREDGRIDTDFTDVTGTEFRAELFVDGASKCECRIFSGQTFGPNSICYGQGLSMGNSASEILSPVEIDGDLSFSASLAMGFTPFEKEVDIKQMNADQAAAYFWSRFTAPLAYR